MRVDLKNFASGPCGKVQPMLSKCQCECKVGFGLMLLMLTVLLLLLPLYNFDRFLKFHFYLIR